MTEKEENQRTVQLPSSISITPVMMKKSNDTISDDSLTVFPVTIPKVTSNSVTNDDDDVIEVEQEENTDNSNAKQDKTEEEIIEIEKENSDTNQDESDNDS